MYSNQQSKKTSNKHRTKVNNSSSEDILFRISFSAITTFFTGYTWISQNQHPAFTISYPCCTYVCSRFLFTCKGYTIHQRQMCGRYCRHILVNLVPFHLYIILHIFPYITISTAVVSSSFPQEILYLSYYFFIVCWFVTLFYFPVDFLSRFPFIVFLYSIWFDIFLVFVAVVLVSIFIIVFLKFLGLRTQCFYRCFILCQRWRNSFTRL